MATSIVSGGGGSNSSAVVLPVLTAGYGPPPLTVPPKLSSVAQAPRFQISGITKDSTGAALAACTVYLFATAVDMLIDVQVSDGSGAYAFPSVLPGYTHYLVAYLAGTPDVAGTTVNTLTGS